MYECKVSICVRLCASVRARTLCLGACVRARARACVRVQACVCKITVASMRDIHCTCTHTHTRRNIDIHEHTRTPLSIETSVPVFLFKALSPCLSLARARSLSRAFSLPLTPSHSDLHDGTLTLHHGEVNPSPCCAFALLCSFERRI